uniref:hypothetical protein n=1 Tax=Segatella hominis TaxID=2518605 RepID=UPI004024E941
SVYVKSFKELFLLLLRESVFLKSECKSTNYFPFHQIFQEKSFKNAKILTFNYSLILKLKENSL